MAIHERQAYINLSEDEIYSRMNGEGYTPHRVTEAPGAIYDSHTNPCDLVLAFLRGSAEIRVGKNVYHCVPGDKLNIPGDQPHSAVVGTQGLVYLMTQMELCSD